MQLGQGQLQAAHMTALERLSQVREDGDAWGVMALVALEGGNAVRAIDLAEKAAGIGCNDFRVLAGYGRALLLVSRQDEARELALRLARTPPDDPLDNDTLGVLLVRTGLHADALPFFRSAVAGWPDNPQFRYNLATALQFTGNMDAAADSFSTVLALAPDFHRARLALVQLRRQDAAALDDLAMRFESATDVDARLVLGHAAAKVAEDLGDHRAALDWLHRAKAGKAAVVKHDKGKAEALFNAASFPRRREPGAARDTAKGSRLRGNDGCAPLFIIGMPRSGTTLVERILSSHSTVTSAGELSDLALLVKRSSGTPGAHVLTPDTLAAPYDSAAVGTGYRARTARFAGNHCYCIDKMPFNFFYVAHILDSLPDARIIMVRRDPRDTVFANYRQLFATEFGYYDYGFDLSDTAHFVGQFNRLADQFAAHMPAERYTEIRYEQLVEEQENESRRLIAFLDLDWEPACLEFHRNAAAVATASSIQVRAPIHRGSVAQWQRYGEDAVRVETVLRDMAVL